MRRVSTLLLQALWTCLLLTSRGEGAAVWEQLLRADLARLPTTELRQEDFNGGTYRIRESGRYQLVEDIHFAPRAEDDFWPPLGDPNYPLGNYFIGFFAAITVEAPNVWIDLNGFTIKQAAGHYLVQRFFNVIELADRIFETNQGVVPLNFQPNDKLPFQPGTVGSRVAADGVLISGGTLSFSSHNGIHGNGARRVIIEDMVIRDFEVAGIQLNGGVKVLIKDVEVGPSSSRVPARGHFAGAWIMKRFADVYIPHELGKRGATDLWGSKLRFADRPSERYSIRDVFDRLSRAIELYRMYISRSLSESTLDETDYVLLAQAKRLWENQGALPDGSSLYGILIHRVGAAVASLSQQSSNFYNDEGSGNIRIHGVNVHSLRNNVLAVPALTNAYGEVLQGTVFDVVKIADISSYNLTTISEAEYVGDVLHDAYLAMWKLANDFFQQEGMPSGRDGTMLRKRMFGGLKLSQEFYDWATVPGSRLVDLLRKSGDPFTDRESRHFIICGQDVMSHVNKGIIGMRIEFSRGVTISKSSIRSLKNVGDSEPPQCKERWLVDGSHYVEPRIFKPNGGSDVRGLFLGLSSEVVVKETKIVNLLSDEGRSIGIDVNSNSNDSTEYQIREGVVYEKVLVRRLRSGHGVKAIPYQSDEVKSDMVGIKVSGITSRHNNFLSKKAMISYHLKGYTAARTSGDPNSPPILSFDAGDAVSRFMTFAGLESEERVVHLRDRCVRFYQETYGLSADVTGKPADATFESDGWIFKPTGAAFEGSHTGNSSDPLSFINLTHGTTAVCKEGICVGPLTSSMVHTQSFIVTFRAPVVKLHGTYGGPEGRLVYGDGYGPSLTCGAYSFENTGLLPNNENLVVSFFSLSPLEYTKHVAPGDESIWSFSLNLRTESNLFGSGTTSGIFFSKWDKQEQRYRTDSSALMVFDDTVTVPYADPVKTDAGSEANFVPYRQQITFLQDGHLSQPEPFPGIGQFAVGREYHFVNGGGVRFLKKFSQHKTDSEIIGLRREFLFYLRDEFGIAAVGDPALWDDLAPQLVIDLGQGNVVQAYAVNKNANLRVQQHLSAGDPSIYVGNGDRIHEGGFRLLVGGAGILSETVGYIPPRSLIVRGIYLVENIKGSGEPMHVDFWSQTAAFSTQMDTAPVMLRTHCEEYGEGISILTYATTFDERSGQYQYNMSGSLIWGGVILDPPTS